MKKLTALILILCLSCNHEPKQSVSVDSSGYVVIDGKQIFEFGKITK